MAAHCNAEMTNCVGASWQTTTTPGSVCEHFYRDNCLCEQSRPQDGGGGQGDQCLQQTVAAQPQACQACFAILFQCLQSSCSSDCNG